MTQSQSTSESASRNLVSLIIDDYDRAITFFTSVNFDLVEDSSAISSHTGIPKRWVVVAPPNQSNFGIVLAQAVTDAEKSVVGKQWADRVGMFLHVARFEEQYEVMKRVGVEFLAQPRTEVYGQVVMFKDLWGNKWDLLGPASATVV